MLRFLPLLALLPLWRLELLDPEPWPSLPAVGSTERQPCLEDLKRFPDAPTCYAVVETLKEGIAWLNDALSLWQGYDERSTHARGELLAARKTLESWLPAWFRLWRLQVPPVGPEDRLGELHDMIGAEAFWRGEMPGGEKLIEAARAWKANRIQ